MSDVKVPIACRLGEASARSQLEEWRDLLGRCVVATDRVSPTEVSLRLRSDLHGLDEIVRLAQKEKACCAFFDFTIRIDDEEVALCISVPSDAGTVLDDFMGPDDFIGSTNFVGKGGARAPHPGQ